MKNKRMNYKRTGKEIWKKGDRVTKIYEISTETSCRIFDDITLVNTFVQMLTQNLGTTEMSV
jgi:hypothetical protein